MYLIRLDDVASYMDIEKWGRMEQLLDKYNIKPLVAVIPRCEDPDFIQKYEYNKEFWDIVKRYSEKKWAIGMHGFKHKFHNIECKSKYINDYSEFVGLSLDDQSTIIRKSWNIFLSNNIIPKCFVAPAHTFDENTLIALKNETNIRIVSDTIAFNIYKNNDIYFVPQQTGKCRKLPLKVVTFCYHPNNMNDNDFVYLENFISKNITKFKNFNDIKLKNKRKTMIDKLLNILYCIMKSIRRKNG